MAAEVLGPAPDSLVRESGGALRLAGDTRIALALINEARYRAIVRVFGCSREQANVASFVAAALIAAQVHERWRRLADATVGPALPDELLGAAVLRNLLSGAAGPAVRDSPQLSNLLLAVVILTGGGPLVARSLRGIRHASHRLDTGFRHRYGYLVDIGHRRARHYRARAGKALAARQAGETSSPTE